VKGLKRWHAEKWTDQYGNECGAGKTKRPKCRPSKRITSDTPVTWNEMSKSQKQKAVSEKNKAYDKGKQRSNLKFKKIKNKVKAVKDKNK